MSRMATRSIPQSSSRYVHLLEFLLGVLQYSIIHLLVHPIPCFYILSPFNFNSGAVKELIQKFFVQLTVGCGDRNCNNPDCATGRGKPFDPDDAASRAVVLVQNRNGQLCRPLSSPNNRTLPQSSSYSSISSDHSIVSQEVGVDGGRSEVTLLHLQSTSRPSTSEPMELTLIPSDVHEHSTRELVIGSSSASMVRSFSQNHGSPSASIASHTTTSTSTASSSSSSTSTGLMMGSSSSSSSSSAIIHMASSNMVDDVARMEVSPTPHHPHRPSSYSPSPHPTQSTNSTKQSNAQSLPVHISKLCMLRYVYTHIILTTTSSIYDSLPLPL